MNAKRIRKIALYLKYLAFLLEEEVDGKLDDRPRPAVASNSEEI